MERSYLGRGWSFPPHFRRATRAVEMVSEELDIEQSLTILLGTRPGERVMRPDYGCNLDQMLFEPLTTTLITLMQETIRTAILYHEARIDLKRVTIAPRAAESGLVNIEIDYVVRSTNSRYNFVYPFYLEESADNPS